MTILQRLLHPDFIRSLHLDLLTNSHPRTHIPTNRNTKRILRPPTDDFYSRLNASFEFNRESLQPRVFLQFSGSRRKVLQQRKSSNRLALRRIVLILSLVISFSLLSLDFEEHTCNDTQFSFFAPILFLSTIIDEMPCPTVWYFCPTFLFLRVISSSC
jgi:hypothetical protein